MREVVAKEENLPSRFRCRKCSKEEEVKNWTPIVTTVFSSYDKEQVKWNDYYYVCPSCFFVNKLYKS